MEYQHAAGGIVIRKDNGKTEVLLIKDSYGRWIWPKGHIEKGETIERAAAREISEETGLTRLRVIGKIGKQEYYFTLHGTKILKTVDIFLVETDPGARLVVQTSEIQDARWFSPEEALEKIEYEGSRALLEKALLPWTDR